jgi:hypothetical protein
MAIARDDLRRYGFDREAELGGDMGFDARIDIGEGADRARNGAGRDFGARGDKARLAAVKLGIGLRQLESEGDGFGMDAVAAADRRGELMFKARRLIAASSASRSAINMSAACAIWTARQVSSTSELVMP